MITLSKNSVRGSRFFYSYRLAYRTRLDECYSSYSNAKAAAFAMCKEWCEKENGLRFRIISYNSMAFTCGWVLPNGNLRIETAYNSYLIK